MLLYRGGARQVIQNSSNIQIVQVNLIHTADHPVGTHRKPP